MLTVKYTECGLTKGMPIFISASAYQYFFAHYRLSASHSSADINHFTQENAKAMLLAVSQSKKVST